MSRRHELARHLGALDDIAGVMSAMRALALMETHTLQEFLHAQRRMVRGIEDALAEFLAWHPDPAAAAPPAREICIVVGSEQGFCGDFNETVLRAREALWRTRARPPACVSIGQRLGSRLADDAHTLAMLPGASVADEVPRVLASLTRELDLLQNSPEWAGCGLCALHHDDATATVRLRELLPVRNLAAAPRRAFAPLLHVGPRDLRPALSAQYLHAALNQVLFDSLMAENRQRHLHMDQALKKLDEDRARLRLAWNAQRQEDITEEIEVILLSAQDPDPGARGPRATPGASR